MFPETNIIWGGYFPSNQYKVVLNSGYVDFVINGPGDKAFPQLLDTIESKKDFFSINNLIFKHKDEIVITKKDEIYDQDSLPWLPYEKLNSFYPLKNILVKHISGQKL